MASSEPVTKTVSPWVRGFVYFHILAIIVWSIPRPTPEVENDQVRPIGNGWLIYYNNRYLQKSPLKYYLQVPGLWQYWDMFAPDPLKLDFYMDANVTFKDGSHTVFKYPRMSEMGYLERYDSERYRKFFERINGNNLEFLWGPVAFRIAQKVNTQAGNPPVHIELVRHWRDVSPPGIPQPAPYNKAIFYVTDIDPLALKGIALGAQ